MDKVYKTAIYLRLSRDDELENESGSIANQRQLLTAFVDGREDLTLAAEYADDGYTGYNFDRPDFMEMMEAVKNGSIECIVVKDFSRLGRNFQKTEEYIQRTFPKLGVRFISVGNCYDSERELSSSERLANPIINLMNEFHVMETSQKVRSVLEHYRRNGKFIGNHTVYGYVIKDKHLEVDEEAAEIVRKIFNLKINGMSNQGIADMLNENGVRSPLEHKLEKGIGATGKHLRDGERAVWQSMSIKRILENPIYIGTLVQGKTTSISYRDRRRFKRDPSDLIAFEDSHEAIVSDTVFLIVQDLLTKDSYTAVNRQSYLFSGFAICGGCKNVLYHRQDSGRDAYWVCRNKNCSCKGSIKEKGLSEAVFKTLKTHMDIVLNHSEPVSAPDLLADARLNDMEIAELEKEIERLKHSHACLREQMEKGVISDRDFDEMSRFYDDKIAKLEFEIEEINGRKLRVLQCVDEITERYRSCFEMTELTRGTVATFIEKIEVESKTKIRIFFRYSDFFKTDGDISGT